MTPLTLADLVDAQTYERVRDEYRRRVLAHKHPRRVPIGDRVTLVFEDRETLRWQVLEMARVERLRSEKALQHELDVYNELLPTSGGLSATLFIEITDAEEIRPELDRLIGLDQHVSLQLGDTPAVPARFDEAQLDEERISAVHYLRFELGEGARAALRGGAQGTLRIDHPHYRAEQDLAAATLASLCVDVSGDPAPLLDASWLEARAASDVIETTATLRVSRAGSRIVLEPLADGVTFLTASPALLADLAATAQRHAQRLKGEHGSCHVAQSAPDAPLTWTLHPGP